MPGRVTVFADVDANDVSTVIEEMDFDEVLEVVGYLSKHLAKKDVSEEVLWHLNDEDLSGLYDFVAMARAKQNKVEIPTFQIPATEYLTPEMVEAMEETIRAYHAGGGND